MARIPPWRWNLFGPWPPEEGVPQAFPDEQIRPLAERLSKQRPWRSAEENWFTAERALRQKPWRPWVIHFSGEKERSGWDWADLLLKVSVPVLLLGLSTAYSIISANRQEKIAKADKERQESIAREQREDEVVTSFIREMRPLLVDKGLRSSAPDSEIRGVARGLTLAALSQVKNPDRKRLIVRFLLDSGLNTKPGNLISLREANLSEAVLSGADLAGADLSEANLIRATLSWADLSGANLMGANLLGAHLMGARLIGADLRALLSGNDLRGADLSRANLSGADLSRADLFRANLSGANLSHADLLTANFSGANLSHADLGGAYLIEADLRGADLRGANLREAYLSGADLRADLSGASLGGADLRGAILSGADLSGANSRADLRGVDLRADPRRADLSRADLNNVKWDETTIWPSRDRFAGAQHIPVALKKQLGL